MGEHGDVESMRRAVDGRRRDLCVVEVTTYADAEPVRLVLASDLATMEADRDEALTSATRWEALAHRRTDEARRVTRQRDEARRALAVAGDELRNAQHLAGVRSRHEVDALNEAHQAIKREQAAVRALHVLRAALHGLADAWDAEALTDERQARPAHDWPSAALHPHARAVRALLNDPQETHQ